MGLLTDLMKSNTIPLQGYRDDQGIYLESDTDEQLLIHIPFNQGDEDSCDIRILKASAMIACLNTTRRSA